jgi:NitT/TauT family transport system substrate-binding protein
MRMPRELRIMAYRHSAFYTPLIVSMAGGFLGQEGLQATYFQKPPLRNHYDMFRRGEVDIMQAAVSTSWAPLSKGIRDIPVHFAQINQRDGFFIAGRSPREPFDWKQLEHAELLADHAQQPFAMLKYGLHAMGVDLNKIRFTNAGSPEAMENAFRHGQADFVHLQGAAPQQLERDGVGFVVAALGDVVPPVAFSSLMANREFLGTDEARAFMKAYRRAMRFVVESAPEEIARVESSFFLDLSIEAIAAAVSRYQQLGTWKIDTSISREQYETAMDVFIFTGLFKQRFPYEDVVVCSV